MLGTPFAIQFLTRLTFDEKFTKIRKNVKRRIRIDTVELHYHCMSNMSEDFCFQSNRIILMVCWFAVQLKHFIYQTFILHFFLFVLLLFSYTATRLLVPITNGSYSAQCIQQSYTASACMLATFTPSSRKYFILQLTI